MNRKVFCFLLIIDFSCCSLVNSDLVISGESQSIISPNIETMVPIEFFLLFSGGDSGGMIDAGNFGMSVTLTGPNAGTDVRIDSIGPTNLRTQAFPLDTGLSTLDSNSNGTKAVATTFNLGAPFAIVDNSSNGLMSVVLNVSPNSVGSYTLSVSNETITKAAGGEFALEPSSIGLLTILPIPEPSALGMFATIGLLGWMVRCWIRRHEMNLK